MSDSAGETAEAGPSIAVQMVGLNAVPVAGDEFTVCETEQQVSRAPRRADCASQEHAPQPEPTTVLVISCRPCRACAYITASGRAGQGWGSCEWVEAVCTALEKLHSVPLR